MYLGLIFCFILVFALVRNIAKGHGAHWKLPDSAFPDSWKFMLHENVAFYRNLSSADKNKFEYRVQEFLLNCRITGIKVTIDERE
jgi:MtfA peptidase